MTFRPAGPWFPTECSPTRSSSALRFSERAAPRARPARVGSASPVRPLPPCCALRGAAPPPSLLLASMAVPPPRVRQRSPLVTEAEHLLVGHLLVAPGRRVGNRSESDRRGSDRRRWQTRRGIPTPALSPACRSLRPSD